jgi:hypothetical protein
MQKKNYFSNLKIHSKTNVLPCRHFLYLFRALELPIYESFNFLPRWLKEVPIHFSDDYNGSAVSVSSSQLISSKRKLASSDRYNLFKPTAQLHLSFLTSLKQLSQLAFVRHLDSYKQFVAQLVTSIAVEIDSQSDTVFNDPM